MSVAVLWHGCSETACQMSALHLLDSNLPNNETSSIVSGGKLLAAFNEKF
jgi:hypothetical protein